MEKFYIKLKASHSYSERIFTLGVWVVAKDAENAKKNAVKGAKNAGYWNVSTQ